MSFTTKIGWLLFLLTLFVHAHASEEQDRDDAKASQYATELFASGRLDEAREIVSSATSASKTSAITSKKTSTKNLPSETGHLPLRRSLLS